MVEEDVAKLMRHEPIIKGWAIIKNDPNIDSNIISISMLLKPIKMRAMSAIYCCILGYYPHLMMIQ